MPTSTKFVLAAKINICIMVAMKHTDIIKLFSVQFNGTRALAVLLGMKNHTTTQYWRDQNKIPKWRWHSVVKAARRKRIPLTLSDFEG
jgi:hypothetical protein